MGRPGFTVMVKMLFGEGNGGEHVDAAIGKTIVALSVDSHALNLRFADGSGLTITDEGQSCCEYRHMSTDDDLGAFIGATFQGADLRDAPTADGEYGDCHEQQFLLLNTDRGVATIVNHNEHNGYYGGFWLKARPQSPEAA